MIAPTPEPTHWAQLLVPALSGLAGTLVGGWIATRNQGKDRRHRRYEEQLRFYAELLSIRKVIRAKSELRQRLHSMLHESWNDDPRAMEQFRTPFMEDLHKRRGEEYDKLFEYSNDQLRNELIPLYRKMIDVWVANMGQAEESTQKYFSTLVDFVEIWNRFLHGSLPQGVVRQSTDQEKTLYPLYDDIEQQVARLRKELVR
jgi:hypothetical protein